MLLFVWVVGRLGGGKWVVYVGRGAGCALVHVVLFLGGHFSGETVSTYTGWNRSLGKKRGWNLGNYLTLVWICLVWYWYVDRRLLFAVYRDPIHYVLVAVPCSGAGSEFHVPDRRSPDVHGLGPR